MYTFSQNLLSNMKWLLPIGQICNEMAIFFMQVLDCLGICGIVNKI